MPSTVLIKLVISVVGAALILIAGYSGYTHIKDIGYKEAEQVYQQKIAKYEQDLNKKIDNIENLSSILVTESRANAKNLGKSIGSVVANSKNKPTYIIKNGECVPSPTFSDSFVEINKRVNQNMKDSQK